MTTCHSFNKLIYFTESNIVNFTFFLILLRMSMKYYYEAVMGFHICLITVEEANRPKNNQ